MVARKTRVAQAAQGKIEDAIETQDSRRATAYANFMQAGDEYLASRGVSMSKRRIVAHAAGFFSGVTVSYVLMTKFVAAAMMLTTSAFIAYVILCIGVLLVSYATMRAYEATFSAVDTGWLQAKFGEAKNRINGFISSRSFGGSHA